MTIPLDSIPRFNAAQALATAREEYGIEGRASALPSERDQNFLIVDARGAQFVLKIANRNDAPELLDFQHRAMRRVAAAACGCRLQEIVREQQPFVYLGHPEYMTAVRNRFGNVDPTPLGGALHDIEEIFVKK